MTARDLLQLGLVDEIVPEPLGGAHTNPPAIAQTVKAAVLKHLKEVQALEPEERLKLRYAKFRAMGQFDEPARAA